MSKIIVHHLESSRSTRVLWLLEELGVPYEIKAYRRDPKTKRGPPELKAIHPTGKSPLVVDTDGTVLAESGFICNYLINKYGAGTELEARTPKERNDIEYNLFAAEANFMAAGLQILLNSLVCQMAPMGASFLLRRLFNAIESKYAGPELQLCLSLLNDQVKENGYIAADHVTGADIMYENNVSLLKTTMPNIIDGYPELQAWLKKVQARPSYARAVTNGDNAMAKI